MAEKASKYKAEVQQIERAKDFEDYQGSTFAKFSIRGLLFFLFKVMRWETLVCHCSHDESSGESHCQPYCQPIQHMIS